MYTYQILDILGVTLGWFCHSQTSKHIQTVHIFDQFMLRSNRPALQSQSDFIQ